jgi:hypothetical protein
MGVTLAYLRDPPSPRLQDLPLIYFKNPKDEPQKQPITQTPAAGYLEA